MGETHDRGATPQVNPETTPRKREPLRDYEFLTFEELMERLPENVNRDAIRKLVRERGLQVHRIGRHRMFYVREVIVASTVGTTDDDLADAEE